MLIAYELVSYFWPHPGNNHRPKLIKSTTFLLFSLMMVFWQVFVIYLLPKTDLKILGYASNISIDEVVRLTNEKRVASGLMPLQLNAELAQAAKEKGEHMLAADYWAHTAPDGTEPWAFFKNAGYSYRYAGENLARDFSNPQSAVDAWMASPTHKDNLLSAKYDDIGIAVVEGDLAGVDTTIIVQLFGKKISSPPQIAPVAASSVTTNQNQPAVQVEKEVEIPQNVISVSTPAPTPLLEIKAAGVNNAQEAGASSQILISPFTTTRNMSLFTVIVLLAVLIIDAVVISKARIARISGRSLAHISFMGMILAVILILKAGKVV